MCTVQGKFEFVLDQFQVQAICMYKRYLLQESWVSMINSRFFYNENILPHVRLSHDRLDTSLHCMAQLKGDFKQRKKSTLSKPVANHHVKGVTKELKEIRCVWKINTAVYFASVQFGRI